MSNADPTTKGPEPDRRNDTPPSEYRISEQWDQCLESFAVNFGAGLAIGGLTSLVLARSASVRSAIAGFGAGAGAGSTWKTCSLAFEKKSEDTN